MRFIIDPRKLLIESIKVTVVAIVAFVLFGWAIGIKRPYSVDCLGGLLLQIWPYLAIVSIARAVEEGTVVDAPEKGGGRGNSSDRDSFAPADTAGAGE